MSVATVRLLLGDLFDGATDMIVLPCSTVGTIASIVARRLDEYTIPDPPSSMELGDISVMPFDGAENLAQYVAYAASVLGGYGSELSAIERIGSQLGYTTHDKASVRRVSAPLLGTGAGGLMPHRVVEALAKGFRRTAAEDSMLSIHVLDSEIFDRLSREEREPPSAPDLSRSRVAIRVFISYSGTSPRHRKWVAELGAFLRRRGINARLDQWHLRNGMDLPQWMSNELGMADRTIIISDARYAERADGRMGGVGWETMLIQGEMAALSPESTKYVVVVREGVLETGVPLYLKTKYAFHWPEGADESSLREALLKELFEVELAPPLGAPPTHFLR